MSSESSTLVETMEEPKQTDHVVTAVIIALTAIVFVLDLMTPLGIAIWALYILPLGFTRWSSLGPLRFIVAGVCTALIILGYLYSPPGASPEVAVINRGWVLSWSGAQRFS